MLICFVGTKVEKKLEKAIKKQENLQFWGQKGWIIRDLRWKKRQITHFLPLIIIYQPAFLFNVVLLQQKRFLMVKVYG
jgi:hypothetical protein